MSNAVWAKHAKEDLERSLASQVSIDLQMPFETYLAIAEHRQKDFLECPIVVSQIRSRAAASAARARGRDPLTKWIEEWATNNPYGTCKQMLRDLSGVAGSTLRVGVSGSILEYQVTGGRTRSAKINGLNSRLSRVRKELKA